MEPAHIERRDFLLALGGGALSWPRALWALEDRWRPGGGREADVWQEVRDQFLIPRDRIYLNNGTLGPQPRVVVEAVAEHTRQVAMTFPPGVDWDGLKTSLSAALGGDPDGFVVPRNTTEAMNVVANGLELHPGDEVVTTDHEHIGGLSPWELVTARRGARLIIARLPLPFPTGEDVAAAVWDRVGPRTRVVSVSHVLFTNGAVVPVAELARRCRERGIVFVVDGAHPPGLFPLDIGAIGADFYASSPHKWLLAPQGTGLLWMARHWRERLWPTLASGDWEKGGAQRFNHVGTLDESRLAGLQAALEFYRSVGPDRIWDRVRALQRRLREGLAAIPGVALRSPTVGGSAGMTAFRMEGVDALALQGHLARAARVRTRVIGEYELRWMRLSTHYYNLPDEVDRVLELLDRAAREGVPSPSNP
ncbi:MAG TPA: aminotransferase class V-fold PLP-dependent enzyme [Longimicrobiales bacterium]|nr:aminotransferase class V-fold PLP-dependent enzyme [Longimicrobiales bacterium]